MMERLTERDEHCADPKEIYGVYVKDHDYIAAANRLADYEDSGLLPEQVVDLKNAIRSILDEIEKEMTMNLCRDDYEIGFEQGLKLAHEIVEGYKEQGGGIMYKPLADSTLMSMTKKEIIELLRMAEHNAKSSQEQVEQQAENLKGLAPVVHGRWDDSGRYAFPSGDVAVRCTNCGCALTEREYHRSNWNYCPVCGAKMK